MGRRQLGSRRTASGSVSDGGKGWQGAASQFRDQHWGAEGVDKGQELLISSWVPCGRGLAIGVQMEGQAAAPGKLLKRRLLFPSLHPAPWDTDVMAGALRAILEYEDNSRFVHC